VPLHFFGFTSTISRFGERFRDDQYSLITFLFFCSSCSRCPRVQSFVKVGARAPVPYVSAPHSWNSFTPKDIVKQPFYQNGQKLFSLVFAFKVAESDTVNSVL